MNNKYSFNLTDQEIKDLQDLNRVERKSVGVLVSKYADMSKGQLIDELIDRDLKQQEIDFENKKQ